MKRLAMLGILHVWREVLSWSGAWWFAATLVANETIGPLIGVFVWSEVFPQDPRVATYYVALLAVQLMTASYEPHTFSERIYEGTISHDLLKPQPILIAPLGTNVAIRTWLVMIGLPLLILASFALDVSYTWIDLAVALPAVLMASLLRFFFSWLLALAAFWTERVHAVSSFGWVMIFLLGGSAAPVVFLPEPIRSVAEALPFRAMLGFPAELATGTLTLAQGIQGYAWQLGWTAVFGLLVLWVWNAGVRRFTAVGG
ncbi:MAG: ABC transporter permease [Actinopolymorphaceae bacterium]